MATLDGARSYLFVPATDPHRVDKALASDAHAVVVDLEDAVAEDRKDDSRTLVRERLRASRPRGAQLVRINGIDTAHARADLAALDGLALDGIVVPKAEPQPLQTLAPAGPPVRALGETATRLRPAGPRVTALGEAAPGGRRACELASRQRVTRLMFGNVDLAAQLGVTPGSDARELLYARSALVLDSVAAGVPGPIDGPCTAIGDDVELRAETAAAKALGFTAKICIHPSQLATVHGVFAPTEEELDWARRVVAAADGSRGAGAVDGQRGRAPGRRGARPLP